ncbi:MAG: PAS domain S-box protein [Pseudomonadota bacterium]
MKDAALEVQGYPDLLVRVNGHTITSVSASAQLILGVDPESIIGQPVVDLAVSEDIGAFVAALEQLQNRSEVVEFDTRCQHVDGRILRLEWRAGRDTSADSLVFSGRDVTHRGTREIDDVLLNLASADPSEAIMVLQCGLAYLPVVYCNESYTALSGRSHADSLGKPCFLLNNASEEPDVRRLESSIRQGRYDTVLLPARCGDGSDIWCEVRVVPISGQDGDARHVVLKLRDVTERVQSEIEFRNKAKLQTRTAEVSKTGGWELVLDTMQLSWTEQVYRIHALPLSYTPDVTSAIDFYDDISKPVIQEAVNRCIELGEPYSLRLRIVDANGEARWVHANGEADQENGKTVRIFGTFQDITDQVNQEQEKLLADQRFRAAFEGAPHGVAMVSPDGRFLQVNDGLTEMLGYSKDELLELTFLDITHPDDVSNNLEQSRALVNGEINMMAYEKRYIAKDGRTVPSMLSASLVRDEKGNPLYYVSHIRDVSAEKHLQRERQRHQLQMQQAQKLESLGVLAGGIAHDFNNLLMGIMGNAQIAMLGLSGDGNAKEPISRVISGSKRAAELCEQLLAYAGKGRFEVRQVDLNRLVVEMERLLDVAASKQTRVDYRIPDEPLHIVGDATQIRQVVMNLITNAADALSDRNGAVVIKAGSKALSVDDLSSFQLGNNIEPGEFAVLSVSDNGVGMDEATVRRIFDPFFTTKKKGRGLGLAAVLGIIKAHAGAVKVDSELDKGTEFTIALPLASTDIDIDRPDDAVTVTKPAAGCTVLFVDDDESIRDLADGLLTHAGYRVLLGSNGADGLALFRTHRIDIDAVILDLVMPVMDGRECYGQIRDIDESVPVIVSSGQVSAEDIEDMHGIAGFLRKPYGAEQLFGLLESHISASSD